MTVIVRIHPEVGEVQNEAQDQVEAYMNMIRFYNPYSSSKEYSFREKRFIEEQAKLFEPVGISRKDVYAMDNDLNKAATGLLSHDFGRLLEFAISHRVFGNLFLEKAEATSYQEDDMEAQRKIDEKYYFFQPDQLFFMSGVRGENGPKTLTLRRSSLTEGELMACARNAKELYDTFEFSRIHYAKLAEMNPLEPFLHEISVVAGKLGQIVPGIYDSLAKGFVNGDEILPPGLEVSAPYGQERITLLTNCIAQMHEDIVGPGSKVRFTKSPEPHGRCYPGTLIDILD